MGLLNDIAGGILGKLTGSGQQNKIVETLKDVLTNPETGGLEGMIQSFKTKGLGELIGSWIGTGKNIPISADQIKDAFGSGQLQKIAGNLGISKEMASEKLAEFLPKIIDKLTPDGKVPSQEILAKAMEMFKGKG
ncbi:MAG: YidB family protein [Nitrospiraceae bacterium]|nr:YidB family protein [Nitrospiraceae bacterium]